MNILLDLFFTFAKIGLFTFGGGYAMISIIEYHCMESKKWITHDEMMNIKRCGGRYRCLWNIRRLNSCNSHVFNAEIDFK